jgi:hypothetical protein
MCTALAARVAGAAGRSSNRQAAAGGTGDTVESAASGTGVAGTGVAARAAGAESACEAAPPGAVTGRATCTALAAIVAGAAGYGSSRQAVAAGAADTVEEAGTDGCLCTP